MQNTRLEKSSQNKTRKKNIFQNNSKLYQPHFHIYIYCLSSNFFTAYTQRLLLQDTCPRCRHRGNRPTTNHRWRLRPNLSPLRRQPCSRPCRDPRNRPKFHPPLCSRCKVGTRNCHTSSTDRRRASNGPRQIRSASSKLPRTKEGLACWCAALQLPARR